MKQTQYGRVYSICRHSVSVTNRHTFPVRSALLFLAVSILVNHYPLLSEHQLSAILENNLAGAPFIDFRHDCVASTFRPFDMLGKKLLRIDLSYSHVSDNILRYTWRRSNCFGREHRAIGIDLFPLPVWVLMDFLAGRHVRDTAAVGPFHDAIAIRVDLCLSAIDIDLPRRGKGRGGCSGVSLKQTRGGQI